MRAFGWLAFLRRPPWLFLAPAVLAAVGFLGVQGWAWHHLHAADAALAVYQIETARDHLDQCLRVWPRSVPAHLLAARAERRAGRFPEAQQHLDECRKWASPEEGEAIAFEWALLQASMGDLRSVEQALQARLLSRPGDAPLIWEALSEGYRRTARMVEALTCLDTWLHFDPDNPQIFFLRGELHRQVGAVDRARAEYQRVVDLTPGHDAARRQLARYLVQLGYYREAAQHIDILLRKTPGDPQLLTMLARSQHDLGQREDAIRLLGDALREHPDFGPALRERGRMALVAQEYTDAETFMRRAVQAMPLDYEANFGLHQALQRLQKSNEAAAQLRVAQQIRDRNERIHEIRTHQMTLRPSDPALHAEMGELLFQSGQPDSAERWLLGALQLDANLTAAHAALARLYDEKGDAARAAFHRGEMTRLGSVK